MLLWSNNSFSCFCKRVLSPGSLISYQTPFVNSIMALIWSSLSVSFSRGRWFSRFSGMLCPARRRAFNVNPAHLLSKIDQISLGEMVKKKNFHRWELTVSGGVDGPAPAPVMWKGHSWWSWRFCHSLACSFCAAFHLGFCLKGHGLKEWQYDGGSILVAAFLVIKFGLCCE